MKPSHTDQVARISLILFDDLGPLPVQKQQSRELLEAEALLHDLGVRGLYRRG